MDLIKEVQSLRQLVCVEDEDPATAEAVLQLTLEMHLARQFRHVTDGDGVLDPLDWFCAGFQKPEHRGIGNATGHTSKRMSTPS